MNFPAKYLQDPVFRVTYHSWDKNPRRLVRTGFVELGNKARLEGPQVEPGVHFLFFLPWRRLWHPPAPVRRYFQSFGLKGKRTWCLILCVEISIGNENFVLANKFSRFAEVQNLVYHFLYLIKPQTDSPWRIQLLLTPLGFINLFDLLSLLRQFLRNFLRRFCRQ